MSLRDAVASQAEALAGELTARQRALLTALCGAAAAALAARLKEGIQPEQCREAFILAAGMHAVAAFYQGGQDSALQEFRAGDMTIRQGSNELAAKRLTEEAELLMRPYLQDGFCFSGV